jgi:hypothetical protein
MQLDGDVGRERVPLQRITAVARRRSCAMFADILWPPVPDLAALMADPGVMFASPRRVVVFQRIEGELRYYAGGWCPDQSRLYLEQDRIAAEGYELGVFGSVADALAFAEQYLVEERGCNAVQVLREVRFSHYPQA